MQVLLMHTLSCSYAGARVAARARTHGGLLRIGLGLSIYSAGAALVLTEAAYLLASVAVPY